MPRFFVTRDAIDEDSGKIVITEGARHIALSLRMALGDTLTVSDGEGYEYLCSLSEIREVRVVCDILDKHPSKSELPVWVTLYMAYPKSDKLETVIQKSVELGASEIVPFISSRCIKRPNDERSRAKEARLQKIASEAASQSERGILPRVGSVISFDDMLRVLLEYDLALFCYEGEGGLSLKAVLEAAENVKRIAVIVGPEGGFSPTEAEAAGRVATVTTLGPRILRCETAPMYALSAISYYYEL